MQICVASDNQAIAEELRYLSDYLNEGIIVETGPVSGCCDVLLLHDLPNSPAPTAGTVVLNSDESGLTDLLNDVNPQLLITYGFNSKASITASSVCEGTCCICVQRAFTTTTGVHRDQQEFTVMTRDPGVTLAAVSALLAADMDTAGIQTLGMLVPRA